MVCMPTLLHIDSSADTTSSTSRELTGLFARTWLAAGTDRAVVYRDLHAEPVPHLSNAGLHYAPRLRVEGEAPSPAAEALQNELITEIAAADVVVVGVPMYNWSIPSSLKAWIDHIHVLGTTAPFDTPDQPFAGKPVVLISSRGLTYGPGTKDEGLDHTIPPLVKTLEGSLGMKVDVVTADLTLVGRIAALDPLTEQATAGAQATRARIVQLAQAEF
ncbi:FMN-dependent NADH-azoreductase [Williamsia limnetica]|jgi:FMN-dependent NADH-azoreductase|uniref:FMN dependent NADH:quinone oxidoreductase n=2 Tax=Williamsia limnetica TaxID=882452 RepID=A0A318RTQ0_WILLI|nr:FMN-dependent NADH-azoreductase [Williamsia limnetica]